jgi:hypothetical protein
VTAAAWVFGQGLSVAPADSGARGGLAHTVAAAHLPPQEILRPGMHGPAVRRMQRRLAQLHYYPGPVDGSFSTDTVEAVWAFKEVQGLQTKMAPSEVGPAMQRALASPRTPPVLIPHGRQLRIEINLATEVLVLYHNGRIELISHVSAGGGYYYPCPGGGTCGPAITPDGNYRARWFARGWLTVPLGHIYNPVFFIGGQYAIHGDIPVPLQPASHGCVRIPTDIASFFYKLIHISQARGTPIYIRGHAPGTLSPTTPVVCPR